MNACASVLSRAHVLYSAVLGEMKHMPVGLRMKLGNIVHFVQPLFHFPWTVIVHMCAASISNLGTELHTWIYNDYVLCRLPGVGIDARLGQVAPSCP